MMPVGIQSLILVSGIILMNSSKAVGGQSAAPLRGNDFVLEKFVSWTERPGADGEMMLRDGSKLNLKTGTKT